ncbi:hypothetical protein ABFT23_08730 [Nocardioides sp. C4-1]|uniref:hypothetical protein n=1 Tax=Nocardioides sp. C4-1 TaxID=3151851 RepID=UPI0032636DC3
MPSRRLLLLGVISVPVAAAATSRPPSARAVQPAPAPARAAAPECLADLIESGAVTHADLVAR